MADEPKVWLFDAVGGFLKGPEWAVPVWNFIDDNCIVFDTEEENKLATMDIFNSFREMVESLLTMHLGDLGVSVDEFAQVCSQYAEYEAGREVIEQVLAVDDFLSFKKMMEKRNMELELEAMKQLQMLSEDVQNGNVVPGDEDGGEAADDEDDFEAQTRMALELSLKEMQAIQMQTGFETAELQHAQEETEDADLRMALALSLQLENETQAAAAEAAEAAAAKATAAAPPPQGASRSPAPAPAAAPAPAPAPVPAPAPRAAPRVSRPPADQRPAPALAPITGAPAAGRTGWQPPQRSAEQQAAAEQAMDVARKAALRAQEVTQAAEQAKAARKENEEPAPRPGASQQISAAEMMARQEHLKKQRDLILAKRRKQREAEFEGSGTNASDVTPPMLAASSAANAAAPQGGVSPTQPAGYTAQPAPQPVNHKQSLTHALASNMKAQLRGGDGGALDIPGRVESQARKVDLELTKAQLRAEAADNPLPW